MKIKKGLVLEKDTEKLVGFLDLGDEDLNCASFSNPQELASHVFVYYVRGDIKFCLGYFATRTMDSKCCGTGNLWDFRKFVGLQETCGTLWRDYYTNWWTKEAPPQPPPSVTIIITTTTICHYHHQPPPSVTIIITTTTNYHTINITITTNCHTINITTTTIVSLYFSPNAKSWKP